MEIITFSDFPPYIFDLIMSYTNEDNLMLVCKQVFLNVVNYKIEQFDDQLRFLTRHLQDLTIELQHLKTRPRFIISQQLRSDYD